MSKVKQWAENTAEKAVDKIINQVKQNLITKETALHHQHLFSDQRNGLFWLNSFLNNILFNKANPLEN